MPCYHPLQAIHEPHLIQKKDGSGFYQKTRILSSYADKIKPYSLDFSIIPPESVSIPQDRPGAIEFFPFKIPCGRCLGCRLDYARQWSNRCTMETITQKEHFDDKVTMGSLQENRNMESCTWFVTFTYEDHFLPKGEWTEQGQFNSLCMRDFQLFMKRLRKRWYSVHGFDNSLMYYYAGEYGDTTARPHYHAILWYLPLFDLEYYAKTNLGDILYNSKELSDLWGKGFVVVAKSNYNTASYTARYCMKKQDLKSSEYNDRFTDLGIQPPYVRMSRGRSIGSLFYEENKEKIYLNDTIILPAKTKGEVFSSRPPRIFDTKYREEFPEEFERLALERWNKQIELDRAIASKIEIDDLEYLKNQEALKQKTISVLKRRL